MVKLKVNHWYISLKGAICRIDEIPNEGDILVTAHYSGSRINVPREQTKYFKETKKPDTEPGTVITSKKPNENKLTNNETIYKKYPNIIKDSIYEVQSSVKPVEQIVKVNGRVTIGKTKAAKGATRCKVKCQTPGCKGIRDIKVQDAFQVKFCTKCKDTQKKENLKKFLKKVKAV